MRDEFKERAVPDENQIGYLKDQVEKIVHSTEQKFKEMDTIDEKTKDMEDTGNRNYKERKEDYIGDKYRSKNNR